MQIAGPEGRDVVQAVAVKFPGKYIEMSESDPYLPDIEKGSLAIEGIGRPVFANMHYAYESKLVNGNKTHYKIPLTTVLVKEDKYEVIYDSYGKHYVTYKEEKKIHFAPYKDFYELLKPLIHVNEEKNEQATQFDKLRK